MHRLNEIAAKLSPDEVQEVEDFAEFLLSRRTNAGSRHQPKHLDVNKLAGILAGLAPDKTAVELQHEATETRIEKFAK